MEYAIIAAIVLAVIRLLVKLFHQPRVEGEPDRLERPPEAQPREESALVEMDATVTELGCYVETIGTHTPHTNEIFEVAFETDDRRVLKFRIPKEMYDGLETGLHGRLTYVDEILFSFEPEEDAG